MRDRRKKLFLRGIVRTIQQPQITVRVWVCNNNVSAMHHHYLSNKFCDFFVVWTPYKLLFEPSTLFSILGYSLLDYAIISSFVGPRPPKPWPKVASQRDCRQRSKTIATTAKSKICQFEICFRCNFLRGVISHQHFQRKKMSKNSFCIVQFLRVVHVAA